MPDPRIHVDFNGIHEDGRLDVLTRHADDPSGVLPGALVELWDEDGNSALGRVIGVGERDLAQVEVMLDTWRSDGPDGTQHGGEVMYACPVLDHRVLAWVAVRWTGTTAATVSPQQVPASSFVLALTGRLGLPQKFENSYELQTASGGTLTTAAR